MNIEKIYELFKSEGYRYTTDSREEINGGLFFALKGENFNGNLYADSAIENGASFAVVDEVSNFKYPGKIIKVSNVYWTFSQLALYHRLQCNVEVIAVGGSNGKTTTKELIKCALDTKYKVIATPGNFNNEIGVPKTLLSIKEDTEIAIVEMGANKIGDMQTLCKITHPDTGLITNIGKEHLEGFKNIEGVLKGERELYDYLDENEGLCFINLDDEHLKGIASEFQKKITYGTSEDCDISGVLTESMPQVKGHVKINDDVTVTISSTLGGDYNFSNIVTALVVADYFEVGYNEMELAVNNYVSSNNRSQVIETKANIVYSDAYNANPTSMSLALENFSKLKQGTKIVMLGDMGELGEHAEVEHKAMLDSLTEMPIDRVILAGEEFAKHSESYKDFEFYSTIESLTSALEKEEIKDAIILLKGSRFMKMDTLVDVL